MKLLQFWYDNIKKALTRQLPENIIQEGDGFGDFKQNFKYLLPSLTGNWKLGITAFFLLLIVVGLSYPQPVLIKFLFNDALLKKSLPNAIKVFVILAVLYLCSFFINQFYFFIKSVFCRRVTADLQERIIDKTLSFPINIFSKVHSGYLTSRIVHEIDEIDSLFSEIIPHSLMQILRFSGGIFFLLYLNWILAVFILLSLPLPLLFSYFFAKREYVLTHTQRELTSRYSASFTEHFFNLPLIKAFSAEDKSVSYFKEKIRQITDCSNESAAIDTLYAFFMNIIPGAARFFVLVAGGYLIIQDKWSIGALLAFQLYMGFVYGSIGELAGLFSEVQNIKVALERLAVLFRITSEERIKTGKEINRLKGNIEFKNIYFGYDSHSPVLEQVSFTVKSGEQWKILGRNGIGKTTLIYLIMQFYKAVKGEIFFDGKPSLCYNLRSLRKRIGFISQHTYLFSGTIMENILYGTEPETNYSEAVNISGKLGLHDYINTLPDKYDTLVEENGKNLSEGQKRKISIIRTFLSKPDLFILDEPEANLDEPTVNFLYMELHKLTADKTVFIITHDLHSVKDNDNIIFLSNNKRALTGKHSFLLNSSKEYKNYFTSFQK